MLREGRETMTTIHNIDEKRKEYIYVSHWFNVCCNEHDNFRDMLTLLACIYVYLFELLRLLVIIKCENLVCLAIVVLYKYFEARQNLGIVPK